MAPKSISRPPYHVEESLHQTRQHHASAQALWDLKWQKPASMGIYPFVDGKESDFAEIFSTLSAKALKEPYNPDEYAAAFFPTAENLEAEAVLMRASGDRIAARDLDLRAAAVYRIARFPINRSAKTEEAWQRGKAAYLRASPDLNPINIEVEIVHKHGAPGDSLAEKHSDVSSYEPVRAYLRLPESASPANPAPVVLFVCGLDAYRTDHTNRTGEHARRGFAVLSVEIPGTGDSPAARNDPKGADRVWSSVLDWIEQRPELDSRRVVARGVSTGGYYAIRLAHTHADRLTAVVAQGGGSHGMFDPDWIDAQGRMEYPYALPEALAFKFGYGTDIARYRSEAQARFSLLDTGVLDRDCCNLFVVNGVEDEIFPVEDSELVLRHGKPKQARFVEGRFHMGNPEAEPMVYDWLDQFK